MNAKNRAIVILCELRVLNHIFYCIHLLTKSFEKFCLVVVKSKYLKKEIIIIRFQIMDIKLSHSFND